MIKSIKINIKADRCHNLPKTIKFSSGLNVLIGDNGVGKSTILAMLQNPKVYSAKIDHTKGISYTFFDFEKMNPRITDPDLGHPDNYVATLLSRFRSHGEVSLEMLEYIHECPQDVILLDEPDANLFIKNQLKLVKRLKKVAKTKQILMSCHSPTFFNIGTTIYLKGKNKVEYFNGDLNVETL